MKRDSQECKISWSAFRCMWPSSAQLGPQQLQPICDGEEKGSSGSHFSGVSAWPIGRSLSAEPRGSGRPERGRAAPSGADASQYGRPANRPGDFFEGEGDLVACVDASTSNQCFSKFVFVFHWDLLFLFLPLTDFFWRLLHSRWADSWAPQEFISLKFFD